MSLPSSGKTYKQQTLLTERLSEIPTMASAISAKISEFQQHYRMLVDDAKLFFRSYQEDRLVLDMSKKNLLECQKQINIIHNHKKEHGRLPRIKGQRSTKRYLQRLLDLRDKHEGDYIRCFKLTRDKRIKRFNSLDSLVDKILDLLNNHKICSQFLGTIALSTPLAHESVRCVRNEKYKPIYTTALAILLFEQVRLNCVFNNDYLRRGLQAILSDSSLAFMDNAKQVMQATERMAYREDILKPLAKAALIQSIGSYSPEVEAVLEGDRYRKLNQDERQSFVDLTRDKSLDYLKYAIGLPERRFDSRAQKTEFLQYEARKLRYILSLVDYKQQDDDQLRGIIQLPIVYSSFMISTKVEYDYKQIFKAYDVIKRGISDLTYPKTYAELFLNMLGRFPLGSGLYFYCLETKSVEKAVVSSLFPEDEDEPVCKQITRQQNQFLKQSELKISKEYNLFFAESRESLIETEGYNQERYQNEFVWNANELWETQVPALRFWKKDGRVERN